MSNKTELQANNVELQEILDSVNALPDAGSGGASVETCTIEAVNSRNWYVRIFYHTVSNDTLLLAQQYLGGGESITLDNVICNSLIAFEHGSSGSVVFPDGGFDTINAPVIYIVTASSNSLVRITFNTDGTNPA